MTQTSLLDLVQATNVEAVRALFLERPNTWISALDLMRVGGALSWRTRISDCRLLCGMTIENMQRRVGRVSHSFYRYVANR